METSIIRKIHQYLFILISLIVLSGCEPKNPAGIRYFVYEKDKDEILAVAYFYGLDQEDFYTFIEGGRYWKSRNFEFYETPDLIYPGDIWLNCSKNCEFQDLLNPNIYYRISEGKTLEISKDAGNQYEKILEIPEWNGMEQNYVLKQYPAYVRAISLEIRGPFYAITDPASGNIFVAMGVEGILIKIPDKDWKFVSIGPYEYIEMPDPLSMLTLIEKESWIKGILIALLTYLFSMMVTNHIKPNWISILIILTSLISVLIPARILEIITTFVFYNLKLETYNLILKIYPYLLTGFLFVVGIYSTKMFIKQSSKKIGGLIRFSLICAAVYYLHFFLWSQGIALLGYSTASFLGIFTWLMILFIAYIIFRIRVFRKKKLLQKNDNEGKW